MDNALFWVQVIATLFIAFTFVIYYLQLRAMRAASSAQNILSVITYLQEPTVREARRVVRMELKSKPLSEWTDGDKRAASLVQSTYDIAGILIKSRLVPKEVFTENWGGSITDCHAVLAPYLDALRSESSGATPYGAHFVWLRNEVRSRSAAGV